MQVKDSVLLLPTCYILAQQDIPSGCYYHTFINTPFELKRRACSLLDPNRKLNAIFKRDIVDQSCAQHSRSAVFHSAWAGNQIDTVPSSDRHMTA
jgi:hypothetical protein